MGCRYALSIKNITIVIFLLNRRPQMARPAGTKKEETHNRMLQAASKAFRANGYAGIGVDGIAKAAGATSGAFYAHLGSKDKAFRTALALGLDEVITAVPRFQMENGKDWAIAFAHYYLGEEHQQDLACGCAMASLTGEVVRAANPVRQAYEDKMLVIVELCAKGLKGGSDDNRLSRAWAFLATLIGGLNVTRAVANIELKTQIASSIISASLTAAGETINLSAADTQA
jgi:TetR/AcrR family transcriptional repressor of nem operon